MMGSMNHSMHYFETTPNPMSIVCIIHHRHHWDHYGDDEGQRMFYNIFFDFNSSFRPSTLFLWLNWMMVGALFVISCNFNTFIPQSLFGLVDWLYLSRHNIHPWFFYLSACYYVFFVCGCLMAVYGWCVCVFVLARWTIILFIWLWLTIAIANTFVNRE